MKRRHWTDADKLALRILYVEDPAPVREIAAALGRSERAVNNMSNEMGLRRPAEWVAANARRLANEPGHASQATRFLPGAEPWNRGIRGSTGLHPNSRATQFKAGVPGLSRAPLGTLRINNGVLERKESNTPGASHLRWHPVHVTLWVTAHGPTPHGHIVVFRPGCKTTDLRQITLDKVECITRAENMRRNSYQAALPPELARLVQLRGVLSRQINRRRAAAAAAASAAATTPEEQR